MNDGLFGSPSPAPDEIWLGTGAGFGSLHSFIPYFTNIHRQSGQAMSLVNSPVYGAGVLIGIPGLYLIEFSFASTGGDYAGLTLNASPAQCAAVVTSVTQPSRLALIVTPAASSPDSAFYCGSLKPGDIVRPHTTVAVFGTPERSYFRATRLATP